MFIVLPLSFFFLFTSIFSLLLHDLCVFTYSLVWRFVPLFYRCFFSFIRFWGNLFLIIQINCFNAGLNLFIIVLIFYVILCILMNRFFWIIIVVKKIFIFFILVLTVSLFCSCSFLYNLGPFGSCVILPLRVPTLLRQTWLFSWSSWEIIKDWVLEIYEHWFSIMQELCIRNFHDVTKPSNSSEI